jgi:hypothetical protein
LVKRAEGRERASQDKAVKWKIAVDPKKTPA